MAAAASRTQGLKNRLADADAKLRPVLTFINGDVSWLVSFPRPAAEQSERGKVYYHAVIDPWFGKPAVSGSSYLLVMNLGRDPGFSSRAALDAAIVEIEAAAGNTLAPTDAAPAVDVILVNGIQTDHCHKPSLVEFAAATPVFATGMAAKSIASWRHFSTVAELSPCDPSKTSWKDAHPGAPLPAWLTVFPPTVSRLNNFGLALITSANSSGDELILMAPHGIGADESSIKGLVATTQPPVKMLALVAPLKNSYTLGIKTVLGVEEGLAIVHEAGNPYYVRSGDLVSLNYGGLMSYVLRDEPRDLQWGIDVLSKTLGPGKAIAKPKMVEVENGGSFLLA
ncbi:hypothetical protein GQ53DRAFT_746595 [Thozetella sp. PMI_491]|nr:hypothetical protein GQ53DRAFT_746595 [Thozetella sp. PMI_491]